MKFLGNFINRTGKLFREVRVEIKKVIWPGRKETLTYTTVVVISVLAISLFMWLMDMLFSFVLGLVV